MYICFVLRAVIRADLAAFLSCPPVSHVHFIFVFYGQIKNECGACLSLVCSILELLSNFGRLDGRCMLYIKSGAASMPVRGSKTGWCGRCSRCVVYTHPPVIIGRYHRRFDCQRGISRWRRWVGLLLLVVADADVSWLYDIFLTICSSLFSLSNSSPFSVRHFSGHLFLVTLPACPLVCTPSVLSTVSGHYLSGSWRLCSVLTCDELTGSRQ